MSSIHIRKDYRNNRIKIEIEILESQIAKYTEHKITAEELLKYIDTFKKAIWSLV